MDPLPFSPKDWRAVFRACQALRIDPPAPPYLRDFLAQKLKDHHPDLASKFWQMEDDQLDEVCQVIHDHQAASGPEVPDDECRENGNGVTNGKNGD